MGTSVSLNAGEVSTAAQMPFLHRSELLQTKAHCSLGAGRGVCRNYIRDLWGSRWSIASATTEKNSGCQQNLGYYRTALPCFTDMSARNGFSVLPTGEERKNVIDSYI